MRLARLGQTIAAALPAAPAPATVGPYFATVETVASTLGGMAEAERAGQPLTAAQLAFINQAVDEMLDAGGCTPVLVPTGLVRHSCS